MVAPVLGLPALLQALATIGVGGAVGYKAQKDLQPVIKSLKNSPEDMDSSELKMLRALLLPNQALAQELKDMTTSKSVGTTGDGTVIGPRTEDIEKQKEDFEILLKPPTRAPEPVKPYIEVFPGDPVSPPEAPVQPEIEMEKAEGLPDQSEELKIPMITYSKDAPEDLKDLVKRSVGPDKGQSAVDKIYNDEIFTDVLEPEQLKRILELESSYVGDLADLGDAAIPEIFENSFLAQNEDFMTDYQAALENAAQETLGKEFKTYRLMEKEDALKMLIDGEFPKVKRLQEDEEGNEFYGDVEIKGIDGKPTTIDKQAMSFTLSPKEAIQFRYRPAGGRDKLKDEDFVLIEYNATPSDIVMRGHEGEKELVLRLGETVGSKRVTPNVFKVFDAKFGEKNIELSENPEFKKFVEGASEVSSPELVGINSQEGGKVIKDITAGVSAQKGNVVPSLLEQSKLAIPIKNLFEEDNQVINYKIGDTVGAYGKDVERSLDIEANVKPDFNIDKFGEVIKQRAKEFDQDAVFVAETVTKDSEGANVGFDIDFGSDLKMKEALNVGNSISRIAELDGFTFKIKNLDTSGTSLYLPQSKKDLELIEKTLKKYPVTEDIRKAGFIMPDGKMLNFSLRGGNVRDTEHRRVGFMVQEGYDGESFGPMYDWMMKTGGIRITGNQNRLFAEVAGKPTTTQINKIVEEYNTNRDKYDSMIIGVTIPGEGQGSSIAPRQDFGRDIGLNLANNLRNAEFRLPSENFYEVTGENANASDIIRKLQSTDIVGRTFTGIRQLNIPEFSNISPEEAFNKVGNLYNNMQEIIDSTNIKTLDKPKVKFYKTKVFKKGKDY
jgi:hypothetical protein